MNNTRILRLRPEQLSFKQEPMNSVHGTNNVLTKEVTKNWDYMQLLADIHPLYCKGYAYKLTNEGLLTAYQFELLTGIK